MKLWSDFYDYVLPEVPGCPQALATIHIRNVTIDFFEATGIYTTDMDALTLTDGTATYDLFPPAGYDVSRIHSAWYDDTPIFPLSDDQLRIASVRWGSMTGAPQAYLQETQDTVRFVPCPDATATESVNYRAVLCPTRQALGIDDWVFNRWVVVISDGAKARLMAIPAKPYSNAELAQFYETRYRAGVTEAIAAVNRGLGRAQLQVQFRRV